MVSKKEATKKNVARPALLGRSFSSLRFAKFLGRVLGSRASARDSINNQAHAPPSAMTISGQKRTFVIIFKINILVILNISSRTW